MSTELDIVELANLVKGRIVTNLQEEFKITGTCPIDKYVPNKVSFIRSAKYGKILGELKKAVVLIPESLANFCEKYSQNTYIVVEDVLNSLMDIQDFFYGSESTISEEGISPTAKIDQSARIGNQVYIGENVYIGKNVDIGEGTKIMLNTCILDNIVIGSSTYIYPAVYIYRNCQIGNDCIIHSGARIGVDGFRFEQDIEQKIVRKMCHVGKVAIGNRVEIGANCTIDRATFEDDVTILSDDVKLDDQV
ncbi:hypothetical protein KA005_67910, partial [bacterium]|nr:hypothetical protein [bacterium]